MKQSVCLLFILLALSCGCTGTGVVYNPDAVESTRSEVDESDCIAVNLSSPAVVDSRLSVTEESGLLTLKLNTTSSVCLRLSGSYDGGVKVKNSDDVDVDVILDNVQITSQSHPGFLKLNTGTENWGNTYLVKLVGTSSIEGAGSEDSKQAFSAEPCLSFTGEGTLNITAKYKTGIDCEDLLKVYSGNINITLNRTEAAKTSGYSEKGFGIKATNGFSMLGGSVTISANDNISQYESRGIKVDGSDLTPYHTGKGYIKISGGELNIIADAKGLTAGWDADEDATTSVTGDDPWPDVEISGGTVHITTKGTPRENSTNSLSPEGIEGKRNIRISGGEIVVHSTDDGIQAGENLEISGGKVFSRATSNDGMDSNGSILISGGKILALGASEPEAGLDADNNSNVNYTGGILVAVGGNNNVPLGTGTTGSFVSTSLGTSSGSGGMGGMGGSTALAGETIALAADGSSEVLAAAKIPSDYVGGTNVLILADGIQSGTSYQVYTSPELLPETLDWFYDAILLDSATLSGGTPTTVSAGTATGGGPGGGMGGGPGGGMPGNPPGH